MIEIDTRVSAVQVFRSGAIVTRQGLLPARAEVCAVVGLPLLVEDGSVRVTVSGGEPYDVRTGWTLPAIGGSLETVNERQLAAARRSCSELRQELEAIDREREVVRRMAARLPDGEKGKPPPPTPLPLWLSLYEWREKIERELDRRHDETIDKLSAAEQLLARLERAVAELGYLANAKAAGASKHVSFRLREALAAEAAVRVEYRVSGARWVPSYVLRVGRDGQSAELSVRAFVAQATGEAWSGVQLSLSTAALDAEMDLPELDSLRIGRAVEHKPKAAFRPAPIDTDALFLAYDQALGDRVAPPQAKAEPKPKKLASKKSARGRASTPPPPAPVMAAAPPMGAPMPPPMVQASMAMPMSAPMPGAAPPMARHARGAVMEEAEDGAFGGMAADEPPPEAEPPAPSLLPATLRYAELRMRGSDAGDRGKLRSLTLDDELPDAADTLRARLAEAEARAEQAAAVQFEPSTHSVELTAGSFDYRYTAEGALDVPNDGRPHNLPLLSRSSPVALTLIVVPAESTDAVRVATLSNPLEVPLLGGPVDVYWDGEFLVRAPLRTTPPKGELTVGLGVEPALKVARNTAFEEKSAGLLRGSVSLEHRVTIDVASRLERAAQVEVRERIPIKLEDDKDTDIAVLSVEPQWDEFKQIDTQPIRGGKRWRFQIEPGRDRQLVYSFSIRIDGKRELDGGNRRA